MSIKANRLGPAVRRLYHERPGNRPLPLVLRYHSSKAELASQDPLARPAKMARVEAVLFLADEPLTLKRITLSASLTDTNEAKELLQQLREFYDADGTAFQIEELAGGYQILTRSAFHPWLLRLRRTGHDLRLTSAAMETLAVIAYKQPITRADIEVVRGVQCSELIRMLMEKGLVRTAGRHNSLGRPQLYGTTKRFLQSFGLNSLKDLPEVESLRNPD